MKDMKPNNLIMTLLIIPIVLIVIVANIVRIAKLFISISNT